MTLRLILGDQLNLKHSWFDKKDESTLYVLYELHQETNYVVHHIQKISSLLFLPCGPLPQTFKIEGIKYSISTSTAMPP